MCQTSLLTCFWSGGGSWGCILKHRGELGGDSGQWTKCVLSWPMLVSDTSQGILCYAFVSHVFTVGQDPEGKDLAGPVTRWLCPWGHSCCGVS